MQVNELDETLEDASTWEEVDTFNDLSEYERKSNEVHQEEEY